MNKKALSTCAAALALLAGCATPPPASREAAPTAAACPEGVPAKARCLRGKDSAGAHYLIVVPESWNGVLVVHAHGGPFLGEMTSRRNDLDIKLWAVTVKAGYAWAASAYQDGGLAVRSAVEDTERVRRIFVAHVGNPRRTILHGYSWGANIAAKSAEIVAAAGGRSPYDGLVLSSGVLGGGARSYHFRLDLRVVYQYVCRNHPRADEPQYPLWMGLPADSMLTRAELEARIDECLGTRNPGARSVEQARKVKTIVDVIRIPQQSIVGHLNWGTWQFQDIAQKRTGGGNIFDNEKVRYVGSTDDAALNAGVARYRADPRAVAQFAADAGLSGRIGVPVLTVHAVGDPIAFVELASAFRETMVAGGSGSRLVQTYTDHQDHGSMPGPTFAALLAALLAWIERDEKPTSAGIAQSCKPFEAEFGPGCRFLPDYRPAPLEARVHQR